MKIYKSLAVGAAAYTLANVPASAQVWTQYGNQIYGPSGTYSTYGNQTYGPSGTYST
jgi:hypothetical protein